jgi:hypothetical protein
MLGLVTKGSISSRVLKKSSKVVPPAKSTGYPGPTRRVGFDRLFQHPVRYSIQSRLPHPLPENHRDRLPSSLRFTQGGRRGCPERREERGRKDGMATV